MKTIKVKPDRMTLTQLREAYLWAEKHQRDFPQVKRHIWEGTTGHFKVTNLKQITVELA